MYLRFFSVIVTNVRSFFFSIEILSLNGEKVCQKKNFFSISCLYMDLYVHHFVICVKRL